MFLHLAGLGRTGTFEKYFVILSLLFVLCFPVVPMSVGRGPLIITTLFRLCYFVLCFSVVPVSVGRGPLIITTLFRLCYFVLCFPVVPVSVGRGPSSPSTS